MQHLSPSHATQKSRVTHGTPISLHLHLQRQLLVDAASPLPLEQAHRREEKGWQSPLLMQQKPRHSDFISTIA